MNTSSPAETVLFLFAHQDDEVGVAPRIVREIKAGNAVHCAYLTNGAAKVVPSEVRCAETSRVLQELGGGKIDVAFIGNALGTADGQLASALERTLEALLAWIGLWKAPPTRLYFLAWEGGHHDHDAVHAIGLALMRRFPGATAWQFPLYNGYGTRWRFFRTMHPLPDWGPPDVQRLSPAEGLRYASLCARYPSQWRTWAGLFPGVFHSYAMLRRHCVYPVDQRAVLVAPHEGRLLYERMFGLDRRDVLSEVERLTALAPGLL